MKSSVVKRSVVIAGHKTSVSIEDPFWNLLKEIAKERDQTVADLITKIDKDREHGNLSSALRLFVLGYARDQAEAGAPRSGHTAKRVNGPKAIEVV
jgi:predicted DNA-binding ribbon-helix-helix protein